MYSRQEASLIRKEFWTRFGQYMRPVKNADGETINWINYKTGVKHIFFRMDVDNGQASIGIELDHPDVAEQRKYFEKLEKVRGIFAQAVEGEWEWRSDRTDSHGKSFSFIGSILDNVSVFRKEDWPAIISFFKARLIALDDFWNRIKHGLE